MNLKTIDGRMNMKSSLVSAMALGLVASVFTSPAMALGPRASGGDHWADTPQPHYQMPADYDANVALRPYTSGLGSCTQGGYGPCKLAPSHYSR